MKQIELIVFGTPVPQGSMKAFIPKGWNRAVLTADNKRQKPWRQEIASAANEAMQKLNLAILEGVPIMVTCCFYFDRPKSLKKSIRHKTTKPDVDKLGRLVLDALTGTVYKDDAQVNWLRVEKLFDSRPRAEITVTVKGEG